MDELAKKLDAGIKPNQVAILKISGKDVKDCAKTDTLRQHNDGGEEWKMTLEYAIGPTFRDIVSIFKSNGSMTESILTFVKNASTVEEVRTMQNVVCPVLLDKARVSAEVLLTITALRILNA